MLLEMGYNIVEFLRIRISDPVGHHYCFLGEIGWASANDVVRAVKPDVSHR